MPLEKKRKYLLTSNFYHRMKNYLRIIFFLIHNRFDPTVGQEGPDHSSEEKQGSLSKCHPNQKGCGGI